MLLLIPLFPFAGFLVNASFGRRIAKGASGAVACGAMLLAFAVSMVSVVNLVALAPESRAIVQSVFEWITSGDFNAGFTLRLDPLSAVMILVVTGIGSLIHIYSLGYMAHDEGRVRYFSYLNLFTFFMLLLVLGGNMPLMFVGWEEIGRASCRERV